MAERLPSLRPREVIRAFESAGFELVRQTGSHAQLYKEGHPKVLSVPIHNREMKRGLLLGLIADAGMTVDEFLSYLRA